MPIRAWTDYQGEQLQVITPDGLTLVLSSWNSKLVSDHESSLKAEEFAQSYVGQDGVVTSYVQDSASKNFNLDIVDTAYTFNKAIILKDETITILPIQEWKDYEGEQLQIKISDGPTIVTAAYDTILINDQNSTLKALDVAKSLGDEKNIIDLTVEYSNAEGKLNRTFFDFDYGFSNGIISSSGTASTVPIVKWGNYEGEQLQIILDSGDIILTSSVLLDLINGGNPKINASTLARNYVTDDQFVIDLSNGDYSESGYNYDYFDTVGKFKYALKIVNGNVTILPLKSWKDFYNNDGDEYQEDSPNCEQLQLVLPDDTALVTTAYDTVLVNNTSDI